MLTDEIMYICIKQNIKYAKVQENRGAAATKYVCMHTNKAGAGGDWWMGEDKQTWVNRERQRERWEERGSI